MSEKEYEVLWYARKVSTEACINTQLRLQTPQKSHDLSTIQSLSLRSNGSCSTTGDSAYSHLHLQEVTSNSQELISHSTSRLENATNIYRHNEVPEGGIDHSSKQD